MQKRPPYHWAILVACAAAISLAALVTPKIGRCGSALYLLSRILAGQALLATGISAIQTQAIGLLVATLINAVAFLVPAVVWYRNAQGIVTSLACSYGRSCTLLPTSFSFQRETAPSGGRWRLRLFALPISLRFCRRHDRDLRANPLTNPPESSSSSSRHA